MGTPVDVRGGWLIYRFWAVDGRLLYIGQTGRMAVARWLEHLKEKDWAPLIARMEVDPVTYDSLAAVLAAEKFAIETEWPERNVEHNQDNPTRVIPSPHRVSPQRTWRPTTRPGRPAPVARSWAARHVMALIYAGMWLLCTAGLWWEASSAMSGPHAAEFGAGVAAACVIVGSRLAKRRRRRRRRRW